jgi:hypothetical protein
MFICSNRKTIANNNAELNKQWLIWNIPIQLMASAQSPDLNPIKHMRAVLKRGVHKVNIKSKNHLKRVVIRKWEAISPEICRNLVTCMHRQCVSVIRNKGYATKYWNFMYLLLVCFFFQNWNEVYEQKSYVKQTCFDYNIFCHV